MFPPARKRRATDPEWALKPSRHQPGDASFANGGGDPKQKKKMGGSGGGRKSTDGDDADAAPLVKKKILGVRRVLSKAGDEDGIVTNPREYEHGHDNSIISCLIASNPRLIGLALSARDPLGALSDDYILSLLHSRGENEIRRDNPGRRSVSASAASAGGATQKPASASSNKKKADKILGSLGLDDADPSLRRDVEALVMRRTNSVSSTMDNEDSLIGGEDEDSENNDQILRSEELYLRDVLEAMGDDGDGTRALGGDDDANDDDGLTWLSKEMEQEYKQFLKFAADDEDDEDDDGEDSNVNGGGGGEEDTGEPSVARGKPKYRFKATITLSRGVNCHLGLFHSVEDACEAVDKATLARRTLGKKIVQEGSIRRAVKARKAAHQETITALERDRVIPAIAAKRAQVAAAHAFTEVEVEAFLTSDKVMQPELNWDGRVDEFYRLDEEDDEELGLDEDAADALALKRSNLQGLENLSSAMLDSDRAGIALDMVMKDLDLPDLVDEEGDDELAAAISEYQELAKSLAARGKELERLIRLEESTRPILEEDDNCCADAVSSFTS